jgi:N-acetyl-D-muramate 6-phosphate phosphatase|tara:strand:+ start:186 stop:866 length:681 start_codon:yes stop_codon:yes gene_type:complete
MSIKGVLFDLDGTLVDTAPDLVQVLNRLLATRNLPPYPFAIARNEVSNGALGLIRLGFQQEASESEIENLRQEFLKLYTQNPCEKSKLFSGLDKVLIHLSEQSIPWGIVTNKPHAMTEPLLKRLGLLSQAGCVVSGDRIAKRKPHPAPVLLGAKELGIPSKNCVYVGDAPRDIEAGRAAGMPTIAASYGYIRAQINPESWGASIVIRQPSELSNALLNLNANYNFS